MAASARLEVRVRPDSKARLERAADLTHVSLSDFVRSAAEERADQVLREQEISTRVPDGFFDELIAALDKPARGNHALRRAAKRSAAVLTTH
jgi:uncharacterized protein (DUF1778 family)